MPAVSLSRPRPSVGEVHDDLHARILTGRLKPGTALSENRVAEEFGLSRTPIRQVFQRLSEAGFLSVVPQVGTFVAPIAVAAIRDAQFVRETLEGRAIREAASSRVSGKAERLHANLARQADAIAAGDVLGFLAADDDLHRALMEIAGHPHVWGLVEAAKAQLDRLRYLSLESAAWLRMIERQHEAIVARVIAGDPDGAAALMDAHLGTAFAAIDRIAAEHPAFFSGREA